MRGMSQVLQSQVLYVCRMIARLPPMGGRGKKEVIGGSLYANVSSPRDLPILPKGV